MRQHSPGYADAVRYGGRRVQRAYILPPGGGTPVEVGLADYRITADRKSVARYSGSVTLTAGAPRGLVEPYGARVQVWDGFLLGDSEELLPVGTMRIDDVDEDDSGEITLTAFSAEKAVEDARLFAPLYVWSDSAVSVIEDLVRVSGAPVSVRTARDIPIRGVVYERERWEAVDGSDKSLARALGVEVYVDAAGVFVIRDIPTLDNAPVWTVDAGPGGVLVSHRARTSRQGVYNAVRAEGDRVEQGSPQVSAVAADYDRASPLYVDGPFGQVTYSYSSPLLTNNEQAYAAAAAILAQSRGLQRSVKFTAFPHPALEPGDVVTIVSGDGVPVRHIFDRLEFSPTDLMSGETRTTSAFTVDRQVLQA